MTSNQAYIFMVFTIVGAIIGVIFDIFRISRKTIKTNDIATAIEDIFFWIITGIIIIYSMYVFCDGQLRFFMIIGIVLGFTIYLCTISKYVIKISVHTINFLKRILITPFKIFIKITRKLIFKPITIICINIRKNILKKFVKKSKKQRGFFIRKENYNSI